MTVGPSGAELSTDGLNWEHMEGTNLNAIGIDREKGWAVGSKGSVGHLVGHVQYNIQTFDAARPLTGR